jgi:predicted phage terminase large subunit-like protein
MLSRIEPAESDGWEAPELKRRAIDFWNKHKALDPDKHGQLRQTKVGDKASGAGLIQELKWPAGIPVRGVERVSEVLGHGQTPKGE